MLKQQMNVQENDGGLSANEDNLPINLSIEIKTAQPAGPASGGNSVPPKTSKKALSSLNHRSVSSLPVTGKNNVSKAYQINLRHQVETEPATVSYNTKVFNKEIMALRNEEEALLKFQNATRKREYNVDALKYKPSMVDYTSVSAQKVTTGNRKKTTPSVRVQGRQMEPLDVGENAYAMSKKNV